jgi:hypothetical protein
MRRRARRRRQGSRRRGRSHRRWIPTTSSPCCCCCDESGKPEALSCRGLLFVVWSPARALEISVLCSGLALPIWSEERVGVLVGVGKKTRGPRRCEVGRDMDSFTPVTGGGSGHVLSLRTSYSKEPINFKKKNDWFFQEEEWLIFSIKNNIILSLNHFTIKNVLSD